MENTKYLGVGDFFGTRMNDAMAENQILSIILKAQTRFFADSEWQIPETCMF